MRRVELPELGDLFEQPWLATMATHRSNGSVLLSAVWWEWDGESFWVSIPEGDIKDRHILRDPQVSLSLAEEASFPGRGLEIVATAQRVADPGAAGLRRIATRYLGAHVADEWLTQFDPAMPWVLLRLTPTRVRAWDHRDEPLLQRAAPSWPGGHSSLPSPDGVTDGQGREVISATRTNAKTLRLPGRDWALLLGPEKGDVRNVTLGYSTFPSGSAPSGHRHPAEEELIFVVSGRGQLRTTDATIELEPGVAVFIPPGVDHATIAGDDGRLELLTVFSPPVVPGSYESGSGT